MSIRQGRYRFFSQALAGFFLALLPIAAAIPQADGTLPGSDFAEVENCEFVPSLASFEIESVHSIEMSTPQTDQEFQNLQLFLENVYLCKENLQEKGVIGNLDQITLDKLNHLDSFSRKFILYAADPNFSILDQASQSAAGMIPYGEYIRTSFSDITDKGVVELKNNVGINPPQGFVFIKIFYKYGGVLQASSQILDLFPQEEIQGISIEDRYIVAVFEPGGDNLTQTGRTDQLRKTISHELIHAYVKASTSPEISNQLPVWFHEGVAIHFSGSGGDAVLMDHYGNVQKVFDTEDYESYRLAFNYFEAKLGKEQFNSLIKYAIETGDGDSLLKSVRATSFDEVKTVAKQWNTRQIIGRRILVAIPIIAFFAWLIISGTKFGK